MFHYFEKIEDVKGNALTGYYVGLVEPDDADTNGGTEAVIYCDNAGTAISAESGVDNLAAVDADGNVSLYVTPGEYHVDIYAPDAITKVKRVLYIPMQSGQAGEAATVTIGTVTTVATGNPATVTNSGSVYAAVLDFEIPMGATGSGSSVAWGGVTGTLADQTDLTTAMALKADLASPALTGTPTVPTAALGTNTTQAASTAFVLANAAGLASPTFTGTPAAPTAAADTNTTQVATTAFVCGQASALTPIIDGTAAIGTSLKYARADHVHPTDTSRASLASPGFTGTPTVPTAAVGTNTTQAASCAFVKAEIAASTITDPWTVVKLTADGSGTSATAESTGLTVAGSGFGANKYFEFEAQTSVKVASGTLNLAIAWPSGVTGSAIIITPSSSSTGGDSSGGWSSANITSTSFVPVTIRGHFYTGGSAATGSLTINYKNASGSASHTIGKGSVLRYREL